MVRTYSFNPSTQSNIILNGRGTPSPSLTSATTRRSMTEKGSAQTTAGHTPRRLKREQQIPFQDNQTNLNYNNTQMNGNNSFEEPLVPFQQKQSSTLSNSIVIEEEQTTLFGIRSVLINGQRFFQPLDLPSNQKQRNNQTSPPAALVLALNGNNNNGEMHKSTSSTINGNGRMNSDFNHQNQNFNERMVQSNNFSMQNGNIIDEMSNNDFTVSLPNNGQNIPNLQSTSKNNFIERQNLPLQQNNNYFNNTVQRENIKDEEDDNVLPWARGCPQPKSGQRGSRSWMEGSEMIKRHGSAFEHSFAATSSTASWPPPMAPLPERTIVEQNFQRSASSIAPLSNISAAERHRLELLHQIEENRRRRALEKQKEWEMEERERIRDERWHERQRAEIEAEKRAEREKALAVERKAAKLAAAQKATEQALREEAQRLAEERAQRRQKQSGSNFSEADESVSDRSRPKSRQLPLRNQNRNIEENERNKNETEEEWWERKDRIYAEKMAAAARNNRPSSFRGRQQSPVVPALRKRLENGVENQQDLIQTQRSMSVGSRPGSRRSSVSSAFGRTSRHAYTPSIENRNGSNSINNGIGRSRNENRTVENNK
ncbi:hypothetical protein ACQ4LE_010468 [Meloidogyne hapla]